MGEKHYHGPRPIGRSPIGPAGLPHVENGWQIGTRHAVGPLSLADASVTAKLTVRAAQSGRMAGALGVRFGRAVRDGKRLVIGSGPGEWLVIAPIDETADVARRLTDQGRTDSDLVSVVDITHGRAMMRLTGERGRDVLMKVCAVDLSDEIVPDGGAFRSLFAGVAADVIRDDDGSGSTGDVCSYLLHCERSSGAYLWDVILDAGEEFGIEPADTVD